MGDVVGVIEAAYETETSETAWLARLGELVTPFFSLGGPVLAYLFGFDEEADAVQVKKTAIRSRKVFTANDLHEMHRRHQQNQDMRRAYECDPIATLSSVVGPEGARAILRDQGVPANDFLGLRANDRPLGGAFFTTPSPDGYRIPRRDRTLWPRIAAHIGAGLRLRRRLAREEVRPDDAAAILRPDGKLEHATPAASEALGELRDAARAADRARGKLRRLDPDEATAIWRAMVRGDWSIVDWIDHDGKRFVVAHENAPRAALEELDLSAREWEVLGCAAMGHPNKLIAYDLGLSVGSVASYLRRAAQKLHASTRVELVKRYRELASP